MAELVGEVGVLIPKRHPTLVVAAADVAVRSVLQTIGEVLSETGDGELHHPEECILP